MAKVAIIYHSGYGHTERLATSVFEGADAVDGTSTVLIRVDELPERLAELNAADAIIFGTPTYMAPEQARGKHSDVDERADVYGLAAILYHALTGTRPFVGASTIEVVHKVLATEPPRPRTITPSLSPRLEKICLEGMAKLPDMRTPSAEAFAELLHQQLRKAWGSSDPPGIAMEDLFKAHYHGRRYSFGYPACPRLEDQEQLFRLLDVESQIGVQLTEGSMMDPESSVSALVFHHPDAKYFNLNERDIELLERRLSPISG